MTVLERVRARLAPAPSAPERATLPAEAAQQPRTPSRDAGRHSGHLTPTQLTIAALLHAGHAPGAIAERLGITRDSVKRQMARARDRLVGRGNGRPLVVLVRWFESQSARADDGP